MYSSSRLFPSGAYPRRHEVHSFTLPMHWVNHLAANSLTRNAREAGANLLHLCRHLSARCPAAQLCQILTAE